MTTSKKGQVSAFNVWHLLAGIETTRGTQLTDSQVGTLMDVFGIKETDSVDYRKLVTSLAGGFVRLA